LAARLDRAHRPPTVRRHGGRAVDARRIAEVALVVAVVVLLLMLVF
jgi:hypothetical protein